MKISEIKLPIIPDSPQQVFLPYFTAKEVIKSVFKVDTLKGVPKMWYQEDTYLNHEEIKNEFWIIGLRSNHDYEDHYPRDLYIGSTNILKESLELHYFILTPETIKEMFIPYNPFLYLVNSEAAMIKENK